MEMDPKDKDSPPQSGMQQLEGMSRLTFDYDPESGDWSSGLDLKFRGYNVGPLTGYTSVSKIFENIFLILYC